MADEKSLKTLTMAVYALQAIGFIVGVTWIVAVIINYVKRDEVRGTWLDSHFAWQLRTFWYTVLWAAVAFLLAITLIGLIFAVPLAIALTIWILYRVIRGWMTLGQGRPMVLKQ